MLFDEYPEIKSFAFIPDKAIDSYRQLTQTADSSYSIRMAIGTEYIAAVTEENTPRIVYKKDGEIVTDITQANHVYMTTGIPSASDGTPLVLVFIPNRNPDHQPWEMQKAITESEYSNKHYIELGDKPREMLFNYAYWPTYIADLKKLKNELALHENWSYKEAPTDDDFPILKSYLAYTFYKQWRDKQVKFSVDGRYSVFNTGLVNKNYQYIYVLFERNIGAKPWKFCMFACSGVRFGGRVLADNFTTLPQPAHYFNDLSDISYIIATDKTPDEQLPYLQPDHYFIDHPERLPLHFLIDGCRKSEKLLSLLQKDLSDLSANERTDYWKSIGEEIGSNQDVYDDLEAAFRNAVRKAVMRASWNYRTAIPVYFPSYNKMSMLLPLSFKADADAEVALVVERNPVSKKYIAPTILDLPTAYSNARLVCKPESDWLNQKLLEPVAIAEEDDDSSDKEVEQ